MEYAFRLSAISLVFVLFACDGADTPISPTGPLAAPPQGSSNNAGSVDDANVPNARIEGTYTATFTASLPCPIPEEVRSRTYEARITQTPSTPNDVLEVVLSGANFVQRLSPGPLNHFAGAVLDNEVSFDLLEPGVVEEPSPGLFVVISGRGRAHVGDSFIPLAGGLHYGGDPWGDDHVSCHLQGLALTGPTD